MHQPFDPGQSHRLGDIHRADDVDVKTGVKRFRHPRPDQARGMQYRVRFKIFDRLDKRRQITDVFLDHFKIALAEFHLEKIPPRLGVEINQLLAAFQGGLSKRCADQTGSSYQCCCHFSSSESVVASAEFSSMSGETALFAMEELSVRQALAQLARRTCKNHSAIEEDESEGQTVRAEVLRLRFPSWKPIVVSRTVSRR